MRQGDTETRRYGGWEHRRRGAWAREKNQRHSVLSETRTRNPALSVIARSIEADESDAAIPITHGYYESDGFHHRVK